MSMRAETAGILSITTMNKDEMENNLFYLFSFLDDHIHDLHEVVAHIHAVEVVVEVILEAEAGLVAGVQDHAVKHPTHIQDHENLVVESVAALKIVLYQRYVMLILRKLHQQHKGTSQIQNHDQDQDILQLLDGHHQVIGNLVNQENRKDPGRKRVITIVHMQ